jgi:hypothetical protein
VSRAATACSRGRPLKWLYSTRLYSSWTGASIIHCTPRSWQSPHLQNLSALVAARMSSRSEAVLPVTFSE